jgi:hypothetical protein
MRLSDDQRDDPDVQRAIANLQRRLRAYLAKRLHRIAKTDA